MSDGAVITLRDVQFSWSKNHAFKLAVPSFSISKGETVLLLGESGSGKSTLLSLICGTIHPTKGRVIVDGTTLADLSRGAADRFRAESIGIIFQQFNLLPFGSVLDNITLPLHFAPRRRKNCGNAAEEAIALCHTLSLPQGVESIRAADLSVGQQQRVAVARALIGGPPILIADEPTSALDETSQSSFLDLLFAQVKEKQTTLLMVSHDPRLAERFDRVATMDQIVQVERS